MEIVLRDERKHEQNFKDAEALEYFLADTRNTSGVCLLNTARYCTVLQ